jgi:hypothetical protein
MKISKKKELTLRLVLRSVYLKGQQDGFNRTSDISWEDEIMKDILTLLIRENTQNSLTLRA